MNDPRSRASGSKVKVDKSEIMPNGNINISDTIVNLPVKINNSGQIEILGIFIDKNHTLCSQMNWYSKIDKCLNVLNIWRIRSLSLKGVLHPRPIV